MRPTTPSLPVINGAVGAIQDKYAIGSAELAQVVAVALIGCAVGAAYAGRVADRIGRIRVMQIAAVLFTVSATTPRPCGSRWASTPTRRSSTPSPPRW